MGEFVRERLHGEGMVNICYRTQPPDPDVRRSRAIFHAKIRDVIRYIRPALLQMSWIPIDSVDVKDGCDGRKDRTLKPCRGFSLCVHGRFHMHGSDGIEVVELNVIFPSPDHLYRTANLFGENRRL